MWLIFREVVSPMTDLAYNLCDTSLSSGQTPVIDIKKKLSMDYESSPSPSSSHGTSSDSGTPLSSITNKPKGRSGRTMVRSFTAPSHDFLESDKENIPVTIKYGLSPGKSPSMAVASESWNWCSVSLPNDRWNSPTLVTATSSETDRE